MENPTEAQAARPDLAVRGKHETPEAGTYQGPYFEPAVDIFETDDALVLKADLPGADAESIDTDVRENLLTITARISSVDSKWRALHTEYREGHYLRQFRLGQQIDQTKIAAGFKDGVLTLTLPKADHARPRRIKVETR